MSRPYSRAIAIASPLATAPSPQASRRRSCRAIRQSSDGVHVGGVGALGALLLLVFDLRASASDRKPLPAIAVWWTNRSLPTSSGLMKP
jgi:hypothetical protein